MRRLPSSLGGFVLALVLLAACTQAGAAPAATPLTVRLIALNDFHGYINAQGGTVSAPRPDGGTTRISVGGAAYLASLIAQLRAQNPLNAVVAAGDLVGASPLDSALFHDEPAVDALGAMGLEFSSVGNHEFDRGVAELRRLQRGGCYPGGKPGVDTCVDGRFRGATFRYLAANVVAAGTGKTPNKTPIKTLFPAYVFKTFSRGGHTVRVAFVGLVLRGTPRIVKHDGIAGLRFDDEAATVNALVPRLKAGGADAIVVLIHQGGATGGWYDDQACPNLAGEIVPIVNALDPAVDVVVSGHTHTAYANCYLTAADGRKRILVTQAGSYGHFVSAIDIRFDTASHAIAGIDAHNLPVVNAAPADPSLAALYPALPADAAQAQRVARYDRLAAPVAGRTVGTLGADLLRAEDAAGESALGDVVADAQLAATAPAKSGGAVAALAHPGGIRGDLAAGTVTYGALYNVQPFGDALVVMSLSGAQLKQVLEEQWSGRRPTMLQVSTGMHYAWDATRPAGDRVTAISIGGAAVDMADTAPRYRIEVNDYIAEGGDGFTALAGGTQRVVGPRDIDALADYLAAHANLAAPAAGRISCSGC